jgi:DsbC/DsbD-like thiol-disulfide interchange protein
MTGLVAAATPGATGAQQTPAVWSGRPESAVPAGATVQIALDVVLATGWHMYAMSQTAGGPVPLRVTVADSPVFALAGPVAGPAPKKGFDPNFGIVVETYEGRATFTVPVHLANVAPTGIDTIGVQVRYQVCNPTFCMPAQTSTVRVAVTVAGTAPRTPERDRP